jgi:hypothetical protein
MFRVGALVLIMLVCSPFFGCSEKTSEVKPTGLELGFRNCLTFNAEVFIDNNYVGSYSSERAWFIDVGAGSHALEVHGNIVVVATETKFCWTRNFNVSEGAITHIDLDCVLGECPASP